MTALLLVHVAATLVMTGLIWFVQIVHYPLFAAVPAGAFPGYEARHSRRTTWVVAPPMLAEAATATLLVLLRPEALTIAGLVLVGVIWASTALIQVPCHARLERGFDARVHRRLVTTNWLRTAAWTSRAVIALALVETLG